MIKKKIPNRWRTRISSGAKESKDGDGGSGLYYGQEVRWLEGSTKGLV